MQCDVGYVTYPEQDAVLTCGMDGKWLPSASCVRSCKYLIPLTINIFVDGLFVVLFKGCKTDTQLCFALTFEFQRSNMNRKTKKVY